VRPGAARTRDGRLMLGVFPRSTERCDGAGILDCAMLIGIPGERGVHRTASACPRRLTILGTASAPDVLRRWQVVALGACFIALLPSLWRRLTLPSTRIVGLIL
jgi:hypothetical protein